jgi:hypothetical protein
MMLFLMLACHSDGPAKKASTVSEEPVTPVTPPEPSVPEVEETEVGEGEIVPTASVHARQLKRMTVSQVRDAMEQISGGVRWGDEDDSDWDVYAGTLGVADYQLRVENDRSPSVMFQKFLDDAATSTCLAWLQATGSSFYAIDDSSSTDRDDVRSNIVALRWQIQGKERDASVPIIDDYEQLFIRANERTESLDYAWQTVCVAMFTHPDFFMY